MLLFPRPIAITEPLSEIVAQFTFLFVFSRLICPIVGKLFWLSNILFCS